MSSRAVIAAALLSLTFAGCSGGGSSSTAALPSQSASTSTTAPGVTPTPTPTPPPPPVTQPSAGISQHPIVLVHGVAGNLGAPLGTTVGSTPSGHFVGVADHIRKLGGEVLEPATSAFNSIHTRASMLKQQIEQAYPDPATKVNLIAHSMGGLDARYMITHLNMGSRVASLTTISTPHRGTPLSDVALGLLPGPVQQVLDILFNVLGWDWDFVRDTSETYIQGTFNPSTPDDPSVYYQSFGGKADPVGVTGARVRLLFIPTWTVIAQQTGDNDGIIPLSSSQWGTWRGEIPAEHGDQVGVFMTPNHPSNWDHIPFYEDIVLDLAMRGY